MRKLVIGMAMASTALASPALARDGQWYVEVGGGPMIVEDFDFDVNDGTDTISVDSDAGYDFGGLVGYDFGAFRLEAEASYRESDSSSVIVGPGGVPTGPTGNSGSGTFEALGDLNALSFMLNGLVDFGDDDGLQGFVGGGAGVARVDGNSTISSNGPGVFDDSDSGFAYQVLAGVRAPLTENWDVGLRYRFFTAPDVGLIDSLGRDLDGRYRSHSILGTLTYNFGGEAPPPPPPPPVAAPPPPPPPVVAAPPPPPPCNKGPYIVFFGWDKSDITPEAATILDNAVSAYRNCGTASVMVAGYTDTSGPPTYNVGLSNRRAAAVESYMVGRGINGSNISTEGFGETNLRVPTADGVRELQNRRVEVTYGPGSGM
ncbi:MAG: OmpA family protein [Allopontixanthobacter sediminis]